MSTHFSSWSKHALGCRSNKNLNADTSSLPDMPPSPHHQQPFTISTHTFPPIPHILGVFTLSTTYLDNPNFRLDDLESLLSSRFISLDRKEFVPTLEKNRQRDSISGSSLPTSGDTKFVPSRSPPIQIARATSAGGGIIPGVDNISVAERFILPPAIGTSASIGTSALIPPPRPFPSMNPSSVNIVPNPSPTGLAISRLRRESMNSSSSSLISMRDPIAGTSSPLSSSPSTGPLPIRKPSIFKSNTISSASGSSPSLSIRQGASLSKDVSGATNSSGGITTSGGGNHSRQPSYNSPVLNVSRLPPSPIGTSFGSPSSLGDRRPGTSGSGTSFDQDRRVNLNSVAVEEGVGFHEVGPTPVPPRKRYSSSFGHRYIGGPPGTALTTSSTGDRGGDSSIARAPRGSQSPMNIDGRKEQNTLGSGRDTPSSVSESGRGVSVIYFILLLFTWSVITC